MESLKVGDPRTPAGRASLLAVCEATSPAPFNGNTLTLGDREFVRVARTALPEAIEYIERLEAQQAADAAQFARGAALMGQAERRIAELERELADTKRDVRALQVELNRRP